MDPKRYLTPRKLTGVKDIHPVVSTEVQAAAPPHEHGSCEIQWGRLGRQGNEMVLKDLVPGWAGYTLGQGGSAPWA